ncbi:MAG: thiamine pyrophosphate-binding protein [Firmicutes bacterium]|nr:thiamine pyrophosphate-binding protein [Bacillota bacterium]
MLVAEAIVKGLLDAGVREVFGLPGGEVLDFVECGRRAGLTFTLTRHEAAAAFMADVTGQVSGRPGACLSTLGPGATNLLTGVANAYLDRSPMIAITGQLSTETYRQMPHQRIDLCSLYGPVTKWSVRVTPDNADVVVPAAIEVAMRRPRGPVHLELASNVGRSQAVLPGSLGDGASPPRAEQHSTVSMVQVVERLRKSQRPAVCAGINVDPVSVAGPLREFVERHGVPVLLSPKAKGVFPHDHPLFVGIATGMAADDRVLEFIKGCDLILGVGFDASEADKTWPATAPIVWLEESPRDRAEWEGDYLVGSIPAILASLSKGYSGGHEWTSEHLASARAAIREKVAPGGASSANGLSPAAALMAIREALPAGGAFVCDVGSHKLLAGQIWPASQPLTFFMSNGLSSMGYGVPGAIAVKKCMGERPVLGIIGDGGFAMMVHELETAVRLKQGVVYVVFNDECLSLIRVVQARRKYERYGVDFGPARWAQIAEGFGARGMSCASLESLRDCVRANLYGDCPVVIEVKIDPAEYDHQI